MLRVAWGDKGHPHIDSNMWVSLMVLWGHFHNDPHDPPQALKDWIDEVTGWNNVPAEVLKDRRYFKWKAP